MLQEKLNVKKIDSEGETTQPSKEEILGLIEAINGNLSIEYNEEVLMLFFFSEMRDEHVLLLSHEYYISQAILCAIFKISST